MFNPYNARDLGRLRTSITFSQKKWQEHLRHRMEFMRQVAGFHYGPRGDAATDHVTLPLLGLAMKIFSRLIASNNPRAAIKHWDPEYDAACYELKLSLDDEFERIQLAKTLNAVTVESFFLMGACKVGRIDAGMVEEMGGYMHNVGSTFCDQILNEDFIFDFRSSKWERIGFCGDMARVPLEWAKENPEYDKKNRKVLTATNDQMNLPFTTSVRRVRSGVLSAGTYTPLEQEYEDNIDLWSLWFPRERHILVVDKNIEHVLQWKPWEGPDHGPYHFLGYNWLPGNLVPLPPMAEWMDQHLIANKLANKVGEMAINQKNILACTGKTGREDADAVIQADHLDTVFLNDINGLKEIKFNGPDNNLWGMATLLKDNFVYFAGNLDAAGGLSPQSPTKGQDELLLNSSSRQVQDMQQDVTDLVEGVMTDIAWYMRNDPTWRRQLVKEIEYANLRIPFESNPASLPGEFSDYRIRLEPYSLVSRTPQQRLMALQQTVKDFLIPMQPFMERQGIGLNLERLLKKYAEFGDQPELADILIYMNGENDRPAGRTSASKSANTTRRYIRENRSVNTRSNKDRQVAMAAFGSRLQPSEQIAISK